MDIIVYWSKKVGKLNMYDVKKRLRYLKQMYKRKIPLEYAHDGEKRYKTEFDRYSAIYEEISRCSDKEMDNLEVLLKCELEDACRLLAFKEVVPIFFTIVAAMVAAGTLFFEKIIDATPGIEKINMITDSSDIILGVLGYSAVLALFLYLVINLVPDSRMKTNTYLLEVLGKVKKQ